VNWCDFRFELDGPQVRRAIAQFCTKIGATLRRNTASPRSPSEPVKLPEPLPAPSRPASTSEPPIAPPRAVRSVEPNIPKPPSLAVIEPVERTVVRSEPRGGPFPKVNFGSLCGLTLMLQGLIMLIGLLGANPPIIEAVLAIATGGSLVIGFRVAGHQSAQSLRLALAACAVRGTMR
jgi:hypothetical protein